MKIVNQKRKQIINFNNRMKNKFLLAMSLVFGLATMPLKAQVKIGFINADYI